MALWVTRLIVQDVRRDKYFQWGNAVQVQFVIADLEQKLESAEQRIAELERAIEWITGTNDVANVIAGAMTARAAEGGGLVDPLVAERERLAAVKAKGGRGE